MKRITILSAAVLLSVMASAVPAKRITKSVTLDDGTQVQAMLTGDEYVHYYRTADGLVLTENEDGTFSVDRRNEGQMRRMRAVRMERRNRTRRVSPNNAGRGIAIMVNFSDKSFNTSATAQERFSNMLNQEGYSRNGATGSARDYFRASSMNQYNPQFDVYGPYTLPRTMSYYGRDNGGEGDDAHAIEMIVEACRLADENGVDFTNYDTNNDGIIDFVFVFYAGYSQAEGASSNTIWPHSWEVRDTASFHGGYYEDLLDDDYPEDYSNYKVPADKVIFDGKKLYTYACASELTGVSGSTMTGIGTFTHEFSHVLGLPDLYATNDAGHKTMGSWDILDAGPYNNDGRTPPIYSAYERFFMGWMKPQLLTESGKYSLAHIETGNQAYMITATGNHNMDGANPDPQQFYLLENRQQAGWDTYLPGHGLMITKIDYDSVTWANNTVNNTASHMGVDIIEADGNTTVSSYYGDYSDSNYGKQGDLFPTMSVTSFVPYSDSPVRCIQEWGDVVSFKFRVEESDCGFPDCLRESFAGCTARANLNVAGNLDAYCDLSGWTGTGTISCNGGSLRIGSTSSTSTITTPEIGLTGDLRVVISAAAYGSSSWPWGGYSSSSATVSLSLVGGGTLSASRLTLGDDATDIVVTISGCTASTKLRMSSSDRFVLYGFSACDPATGVSERAADDIRVGAQDGMLMISGLGDTRTIAVYTPDGRLVRQAVATDAYRTELTHGLYVVVVGRKSYKVAI